MIKRLVISILPTFLLFACSDIIDIGPSPSHLGGDASVADAEAGVRDSAPADSASPDTAIADASDTPP